MYIIEYIFILLYLMHFITCWLVNCLFNTWFSIRNNCLLRPCIVIMMLSDGMQSASTPAQKKNPVGIFFLVYPSHNGNEFTHNRNQCMFHTWRMEIFMTNNQLYNLWPGNTGVKFYINHWHWSVNFRFLWKSNKMEKRKISKLEIINMNCNTLSF